MRLTFWNHRGAPESSMQSLLPKDVSEFRRSDFWNRFHGETALTGFEWYGSTSDVRHLVEKAALAISTPVKKVLQVGCGNSDLHIALEDIFQSAKVVNVDVSAPVIEQQRIRFKNSHFDVLDITNEPFPSADVIVDKAFLDAYVAISEEEKNCGSVVAALQERCSKYLGSVIELVERGSTFFLFTLGESCLLSMMLKSLLVHQSKIMLEVTPYCVKDMHDSPGTLQPLMIIIRLKGEGDSGINLLSNEDSYIPVLREMATRYDSLLKLPKLVKDLRNVKLKLDLHRTCAPGMRRTMVVNEKSKGRAYELGILDSASCSGGLENKTSVVLVPRGQEYDVLFLSVSGNEVLCQSAGCSRVVVVTRLHELPSNCNNLSGKEADQMELIDVSQDLTDLLWQHLRLPGNLETEPLKVVTMETEEDEENLIYSGRSVMGYEIQIYETRPNVSVGYRTMKFSSQRRMIQSEVPFIIDTDGKYTPKFEEITSAYLTLVLMALAPLWMRSKNESRECVVLGSGGGVVSKLLQLAFPGLSVHNVEIDQEVIAIAKQYLWYETPAGNAPLPETHVGDALSWINDSKPSSLDAVLVDINQGDLYDAIACPARVFRTPSFFIKCKCALKDSGVLLINLVTRSEDARRELIGHLKQHFVTVAQLSTEAEVNDVILCTRKSSDMGSEDISTADSLIRTQFHCDGLEFIRKLF